MSNPSSSLSVVNSDGESSSAPLPSSSFPASSSLLKVGLLTKRGGLRKSWKSRYFVLYSDGLMYYFDTYESFCTNNNKAIKGMITIKGGTLLMEGHADLDPKWYSGKKNVFAMKCGTTSRVYVLSAENHQEKESWIRTISAYLGIPVDIDHSASPIPPPEPSSASSSIIDQRNDVPPHTNSSITLTSSSLQKDKRCNFPSCDKTFTLLRKGVCCYDCKLVYCAVHCVHGIDLPIPHGHQLICDQCIKKRKDEEEKEKQDLLNAFIQSGDNGGGRATIVAPTNSSSLTSVKEASNSHQSIALSSTTHSSQNNNNSVLYNAGGTADSLSKETPREYYAAPPSLHQYEIADDESDEYIQLQEADHSAAANRDEKKKSKSSCQCCLIQ